MKPNHKSQYLCENSLFDIDLLNTLLNLPNIYLYSMNSIRLNAKNLLQLKLV